jgi:hypothetical protein
VSLLEAKGKLFDYQDKKGRLAIELLTYGTIIDHHPAEELEIFCNYEDNVLDIVSARVGSQSSASGTIDFNKRPPEIKLLWNVEKINFTDLLAASDEENTTQGSYLEGGLSGKIYIENSLFDPFIKIALEGEKGNFWGVKFERANINLKGNYPILAFHDSRVYREEGGFFILDGKIDLREIGKQTFFDDIKILSDEKTIVLDGWDIARGVEQSEITLKKAVSEDLKVGFKTFINDKMQDLSNESDALELEYKLQGNRSLFMRFEKDEELFGVRHKLKF